MQAIIIIGGILIFILLFAVLTTIIGEVATTKRYKRKLAEYDLRMKILKEIQEKDLINLETVDRKNSRQRKNTYSTQVHAPLV